MKLVFSEGEGSPLVSASSVLMCLVLSLDLPFLPDLSLAVSRSSLVCLFFSRVIVFFFTWPQRRKFPPRFPLTQRVLSLGTAGYSMGPFALFLGFFFFDFLPCEKNPRPWVLRLPLPRRLSIGYTGGRFHRNSLRVAGF